MKKSYVEEKKWGELNGEDIFLLTLKNENGLSVSVSNFGAIIQSIEVPTQKGKVQAVLGFNTLEEYLSDEYRKEYPYFGVVIGRNAGRIKNGKTTLNGEPLQLSVNHNGAQLHGGFEGFDSKIWLVKKLTNEPIPSVTFTYFSEDGEEGYPGNVTAEVTYSLDNQNQLRVDYHAVTDRPTIVNLTQHSYFNFNAGQQGDVLGHKLHIHSDRYVPLNPDYSPTGEILPVEGTFLDYRSPKEVHPDIDNSFIRQVDENHEIGSLFNEDTNLKMSVSTNHPVLHIYAGYYVPELAPKDRKHTGKCAGICFEAQGFADALNYPQFQSTQLNPNQEYQYHTIFKFSF